MMNVTATALRPGRVRFQINPMPEYLYLIHPYRHGFFDDPTPEEQTVMDEHFNYLKRAADAGTVLLAGPCLDDTFGRQHVHVQRSFGQSQRDDGGTAPLPRLADRSLKTGY
jgi:hypothetical protein